MSKPWIDFKGRRHTVGNVGRADDEARVDPGSAPLQAWQDFAKRPDGRR